MDYANSAPLTVFKTTLYATSILAVAFGLDGFLKRTKRQRRVVLSDSQSIDPEPRHGGDLVAEALVKHGVSFVFCLVGGHISPILVGCKRRGIRVIDVRHEATAVFAADAVSRISRKEVGVACVTAGPGVTNTITAIQNAFMAQSPLIVLGGATLGLLKNKGSLQDIDQLSLVEGIVKWKTSVSTIADIIPTLERAFFEATNGVPGPVFVELPLDVLYPEDYIRKQVLAKFEGKSGLVNTVTKNYLQFYLNRLYGKGVKAELPSLPWTSKPQQASNASINKAVVMLLNAKKPVMVVGSPAVLIKKDFGAGSTKERSSIDDVIQAIRKLQIPVFLAGGARGCLGTDSEEAKLHIRHKRSAALKQADVVILLGVPCDFRLNYGFVFRRHTKVISVALDKQLLNLNKRPTLAVNAEVPHFVVQLEHHLSSLRLNNKDVANQTEKDWEAWRVVLQEQCDKRDTEIQQQAQVKLPAADALGEKKALNVCNPLSVCLSLNESLLDNSILVCDGGDFIGTAAYTVRPRRPLSWLDPGPFGTLGVGAGFALGAKLVRPEADVWLLWGDGSAAYSLMEYDTFVRHGVNVMSVIGNDACWRQIHRDQIQIFEQDDVGCALAYSDYHEIARALGGEGHLVDRNEDMKATVTRALVTAQTKPVLVNVLIGKTNFRDGSISV